MSPQSTDPDPTDPCTHARQGSAPLEIALLSNSMTVAVDRGDIDVSPCKPVKRNLERPRTEAPEPGTFVAFIAWLNTQGPQRKVIAMMAEFATMWGSRRGPIQAQLCGLGCMMGRRRQSNFDDPPRFHRKGTVWYHVSGTAPRVWTKLSSDRAEALRLWAQREGVREDDSTKLFSVVARRYVREVLPTKGVRTRKDNEKELVNLLKVFAHMPIDAIAPMHIREYMDLRGQAAPVRANREKALFSHIFNKAREWGYTALQNPCRGVKGFRETGRSRYITDDEFEQVRAQAHFTVVDAMDLALLTGQRPADVLKLKRADIRDGALWVTQNKTGARLGIEIVGELAAVIARISARPRHTTGFYLVQDDNGQPLSQFALRSRFDKARELAEVSFQFRDIRAKAATDTGDLAHSQKLLAHKNRDMIEHYVRSRIGERVKPLR